MRPGKPTEAILHSHLGLSGNPPSYMAIRPSSQTGWVAVDIDQAGSPYHPDRGDGTLEPLLERLALIGLRKPLIFQSSHSRGLHLWYPLRQPHKTFDAALSIQLALEAGALDAGELGETVDFEGERAISISPGLLEIFPNVKQPDSDYRAIRLPFTGQGNGVFIDIFGVVEEPGALPALWRAASKHNSLVQSIRISKRVPDGGPYNMYDPEIGDVTLVNWVHPRPCTSIQQPVHAYRSKPHIEPGMMAERHPQSLRQAELILKGGWSGKGQTHRLSLAALIVASHKSDNAEEIAQIVRQLLISAPGFAVWSGHTKQIESRALPGRAACRKAARFTPSYQGTWRERSNQKKADKTAQQALDAISGAKEEGILFPSANRAIAHLRCKHGGPSRAWWLKSSSRQYLEGLETLVRRPIRSDQSKQESYFNPSES